MCCVTCLQARQGGIDAQARGLDNRKVSVTGKRWLAYKWQCRAVLSPLCILVRGVTLRAALEASSGASGMRVASGKQLDESDDWGNDMGALLPT